jgi:hypothetical protein
MSERANLRALTRLAASKVVLAEERQGGAFAVFPTGDRRRRPVGRLSAESVRQMQADGALAPAGEAGGFVLSQAGHARLARAYAAEGEHFLTQHAPLIDRSVMDAGGGVRTVRGFDVALGLRRLAALRDANGAPWLSSAELAAATQLRTDWDQAQAGLVRGSDWRAPPNGASARGLNGQDAAMAARCDARRRFEDKLSALAPPLRRAVERVCLYDDGLEALERAERWPARSAKVALKMGLAQLAAR